MEVRPARDAGELQQALALRVRVFTGEQGVDRTADQDEFDRTARHFVAVEDGRVIGTCRVYLRDGVGRVGRMVVEAGARGRGVGARLLEQAEAWATEAGAELVRLHAQTAAAAFYARAGYAEVGEPFLEEGIDHVTMERRLA